MIAWTPDLDKRLLELADQGLAQPEIAKAMSAEFSMPLSRDAIKNRLLRLRKVLTEEFIKATPDGFRVRVRRGDRYHTVGVFPTMDEAVRQRDEFLATIDAPKVETEEYSITGVTAQEMPSFETAYKRAVEAYQKKSLSAIRKASQRIDINSPRACFVFIGDQHIGNQGTDIERVFDEARVIASMRNTYPVTLGDLADNQIVSKLLHLNMNNPIPITDAWIMFEEYIKILRPKVIVGGNHDNDWTQNLTGMDYVRHTIAKYVPNALYDTDDCRLIISVGGVEFPTRIRHKWKGTSQYNPTHGPEKGQKWDQDFVLGVSGHIHQCGVARPFNAGGRSGMAVLVGAYKLVDTFAQEQGFPKPNGSTAIAVVFDAESRTMTGFESLNLAAEFMEKTS